ncbi:Mycothiol maleylpyruvate isomerase N-terminal domain-containing protein [Friedmanniella luteola]|uniref:Mycothiol maleylpyruvate isomerase N-terminal domain-containing protein n=1 Tax=Friedmanniella luteola TaxID=546871 RepID=A0A1H1RTX6_9ACTN|nr:maleylpyruvate isomerase N-terminal domain-containing protein [Friedmanniella luteola]SDS39130.1 Mycothiol maleylpyruvate isomerase N-terminal domain-containing protein [Friedmanniella luteola]
MPLTFAGTLDRDALLRATDALADLVAAPEVAAAWEHESSLPGLTVGGLTRHLVSQPECAVEFLGIQPPPPHAPVVSLAELYRRTDWFTAPVEAAENTSIRDDFNAMAADGPAHSLAVLREARAALPAAVSAAGAVTYVPWQDCSLATDDFLVVRLLEVVVHADDLAASVARPSPAFDDDTTHPVLALLAILSAQQHGPGAALRTLARAERAGSPTSAFQGPVPTPPG